MDSNSFSLIWFIGSVGIFLFGIRISRMGLQLWGGDRLRGIIASLTENRLMGLAVGALVTVLLQSSSATANMLVSFAGAGMMTLTQAMGVLLGADIGTTLVVILLSVRKISEYAMLVLTVGVVLDMVSRKKKNRYISMVLVGFGFIFLGLHLLTDAAKPLKDIPLFVQIIGFLSQSHFYSFLMAVFLTPFLSSAGMIGLVIALSFSGLISFEAALPFVLGANVGTCVTSLVSSFSGSVTGRQVAAAHFLFKAGGVIVFFPLIHYYAVGIGMVAERMGIEGSISGRIALGHTLFNLFISILFLPFIKQGAWIIEKLIPSQGESEKRFAPKYLNPNNLETPSLAFASVKREILRVADLVHDMFRDSILCYEKADPDVISEIESRDDQVDLLDREIKLFMSKLSQENLTDEQAKLSMGLLAITGTLEEIGDIVSQNILDLAAKKSHKGTEFSAEGWREIRDYHSKIMEPFSWAISGLASSDQDLAHKVVRMVEHLEQKNEELRAKHLARLQAGLKESFETSSFHLDTLSAFSRIARRLGNLVKPIIEMKF